MESGVNKKVNKYIKEVTEYLKAKKQYEKIDVVVLDNLADNYKTILLCNSAIEEHGILVSNASGNLVANKAIKIKQDAIIRFEKSLEILGLQGKQRYKDKVEEPKESVLDKLINE